MRLKRFIAALLATVALTTSVSAKRNEESVYVDVIINYIANLYIDNTIIPEDLKQYAMEEMVRENPEMMYEFIKKAFTALDVYSEFYTAEEYEQYFQQLNHIFYGLGVKIQRSEGGVEVIQVIDGGGAIEAGLKPGDFLVEVDGTNVEEMSLEQITSIAAGDEGTVCSVKVRRDGVIKEFSVERKKVNEVTVAWLILEGNIGYMNISSFSEATPANVEEALSEFEAEGVENIILDMRYNPGGMLTSVVDVAKMIVPEGAIVHTIYRDESQNLSFYSENKNPKFKFAVLVNGDTASAAEVLTGALQDSGVGYVIGETTYGKGLIQNVFNLPNGDAFKLTTGHYLTRNGNDINETGIEPDEIVKNQKEQIDISKYETFDYKHKWHVGETGKGVLAAKQRLSIMGYYYGEINEYFDKALEKAVYDFQKDVELYPYGVLDFSTQATMENHFYVMEVPVDNQLYTAYEYFGGIIENLE